MNNLASPRPCARLGALTCATILATSLAASVAIQRQSRVPACVDDDGSIECRLDAAILRAIDCAYADRDFDLADSLERIRATRAAAR